MSWSDADGRMTSSESNRFTHFPVSSVLPFARVSIESTLILWFATSPFASFYIRFPHERSLVTFDRAIFAIVGLTLLIKSRRTNAINPGGLRSAGFLTATRFEVAWALLSIVALISAVVASNNSGYATKMAVDSFCLPLLAFHFSRHHFDARNRVRSLALSAIWLAWSLFATGAFEFVTGVNLFPYKGSELLREGERRINGPFAADSSFAIICLLIALFLFAMPRLFRLRFDASARLVYAGALAAGVLASLLPLFRSVAFALLICWAIIEIGLANHKASGRDDKDGQKPSFFSSLLSSLRIASLTKSRLLVFVAIALAVIIAEGLSGAVRIEKRLADPRNVYGRLATWTAAAEVALENPIFGVGLSNYSEYFDEKYNWAGESAAAVLDANAANSPHSNPLWIMAELGMIGFVLYLAANIYLFLMGYRALKSATDKRQRLAATCFLALAVAYLIPGLTLASGYYSDLNLTFFFLLGVLSNKSLVAGSEPV
ncbi:MAG TPA: O-antigen ligase family protein [Blastocatellia bacterium]|nr:O-antigen ligase family protein [Blastocatellia bacterium]